MAVDEKRTKDDVRILISFFSRDIVDMTTCSGDWLDIIHLAGWLTTANGFSWLVLRTLTHVVPWFSALEAGHSASAWSKVGRWSSIGLSRCKLLSWARRLIGWPRCVLGWQSSVGNPHTALVRARAG